MNTYRIMNRITHEWWQGEAGSVQKACEKAGWPIEQSLVKQHSAKGCGGWKNPDKPFKVGFTKVKTAFVKASIESKEREKRLNRLIGSP